MNLPGFTEKGKMVVGSIILNKRKNSSGTKRRVFYSVVLITVSVAFTLLLGEAAARFWLWKLASNLQIAIYGTAVQVERIPLKHMRHHYLPFIPRPNFQDGKNKHNSLGFRGDEVQIPKPDGTFRIVLLGGSTTYTSHVQDYQKSYPYILQSNLQRRFPSVEVVNAGAIKYSTWESLANLEFRVLDLEPDLIVVYHGVNDVHNRLVYPYEAYRGDNSGSRVPYVNPEETFWDRSALLRILRTRFELRRPVLLYIRTHDYLPTNFTMEFLFQKLEGRYPSGVFLEHSAEAMLKNNPPTYFKRNIENMVAICKVRGIKVVLMTFAWSSQFPKRPFASSNEYQEAYEEQNTVIKQLCNKADIHCYDFADEMPMDPKYWQDGVHVNSLGAEMKAELLAQFLFRAGLLPETRITQKL